MKKMLAVLVCVLTFAGLAGCGSTSDSDETAQQVAAYRAAVPDAEDLMVASAPRAAPGRVAAAAGDPALYPPLAIEVVPQVNGIVTDLIDTMQTIVNSPHNIYDPQEQMVLWGPFPNDEGAGQIVVVITKEEPTADDPFEYIFALLRVPTGFTFTNLDALETETVVIFGAAAPAGAEGPAGLAVFDFDANATFAQAQGELGTFTTGGFATAFGRVGPDAELDGVLHLVIAAFRDFVPEDAEPGTAAVNVDYLYGHFVPTAAGQPEVDFVEFDTQADADDTGAAAEDLDIRMAFINQSEGRAEATATGGDLGLITADSVECWNAALQREYLSYQQSDGGLTFSEGSLESCGFTFSQTLDDLQIPSLASLALDDPDLMNILDELARSGWAGTGE